MIFRIEFTDTPDDDVLINIYEYPENFDPATIEDALVSYFEEVDPNNDNNNLDWNLKAIDTVLHSFDNELGWAYIKPHTVKI